MLQMFESSWRNNERRSADIFLAGYGQMWIPPMYRADSGNQSVGYDVYDRFDLGNAANPTLYGTETGVRRMISENRRAGIAVYADLVLNHNGFNDQSNSFFVNSGGYPGFVMSQPGNANGDFHAANATGDLNFRLSGLIDIDQATNYPFVRNPIPNPRSASGQLLTNLPAGTVPQFGRLANVPTEANRKFYQDRSGTPSRIVFNPTTGQGNIPIYDFTPGTATTGTPVEENALGYLMRHTQWMLQDVGVDGFRLDATKHIPTWVFNDFFDMNVYRGNPRLNLDGSRKNPFSFGENFDGSRTYLQTYIRKDINPNDPGRVGGNRDTKDFPLYFAMQSNLTSNGTANDWRNVVNSSQDAQDDGFANNGSQGVAFAQSADSFGPYLSNVAYAYMLMRPGNAIVYFNAKEFGTNRDFPKDGRGDALGGLYGNGITKLVQLRNTHGRGNYLERWLEKETLIYERDKSSVVALSNRVDNGFDTRTIQTNFGAGTRLLEMTGNATDPVVDPNNNIADFVVVDSTGKITISVPRNKNVNGVEHGKGYVVYGLPTPQGTLSVTNVAQTIAPETPTATTNGTARLASIDVVTANSFNLRLQTTPVVIGGFTDTFAGGDNAVFSINGGVGADGMTGVDLNGNGQVDYRTPNTVVYGSEEFVTKKSPLVTGGDGEYLQSIDSSKLFEGYNYIEVKAFRSRPSNEPAVYSSFRKVIYVDRLKPTSSVSTFLPWDSSNSKNRDLIVKSNDMTATQVNVFLNLPAGLTEAQILQRAVTNNENPASQYDRDLFKYGFFDVPSGNNVITIVTREITGNYSIQRIVGQSLQTNRGVGLGDLNFDGAFTSADVAGTTTAFEFVMNQKQQAFNPAGDFDGNGRITYRDALGLRKIYRDVSATSAATQMQNVVGRRGDFNSSFTSTAADIDILYTKFNATGDVWLWDLDDNGAVGKSDVDMLVFGGFETRYGDANLDKTVDFNDLLSLAANYNAAGGWATGDFTGDGVVNFDDLLVLAGNYNQSGPGADVITPPAAGSFALAQTLVPEPATLALFGAGAVGMLSRRRRG